jgi:plasmid stability protein
MAQKKAADAALVSVRITRALKTRAKTYAAKSEREMREILDEALDEYLRKRGA